MRRTLPASLLATVVLFTACSSVDTTGLSDQSSRGPRGNAQSPVVVTEYGDLQCPACGSAHTSIDKPLLQKYGKDVGFEFKHFPLDMHEYALEAAQAAECAADQGKVWEFVYYVYEHQKDLNSDTLRNWGLALNLDPTLFDRCIRSGIKKKTIAADQDEGLKLGVRGTPTYFVSGTRVDRNALDAIETAMDAQLKRGTMPL